MRTSQPCSMKKPYFTVAALLFLVLLSSTPSWGDDIPYDAKSEAHAAPPNMHHLVPTNDRNLPVEHLDSQTSLPGCRSSRLVLIDNSNNSQSLTDYQVKLDVEYLSGMSADFSDLRFTNSSGAALDYWLESYTASTEATVWIEVDIISANDSTLIYMWYDSCSGGNSSNADTTFLLFDDFNDGTYTDKWTPSGTVVESGGVLELSGCHYSTANSLFSVTAPVIIEARTRRTSGLDTLTELMSDSTNDYVSFGTRDWDSYFTIRKGGTNFGTTEMHLDLSTTAWKEYRAILHGTTFQVYRGSELDVWERNDTLTLNSSSDGMSMHVQLFAHEVACAAAEWDWIRIRQYSEIEPEAEVLALVLFVPLVIYE